MAHSKSTLAYVSFAVVALSCYVAVARMAYQLPAGSDLILRSPVKTSFQCGGKIYGYYADTDNDCQIFHVCLPIPDDTGAIIDTAQFSFLCPNQTVFSQDTLTCSHPDDALPCSEAPRMYDVVNGEFGKIPVNNGK